MSNLTMLYAVLLYLATAFLIGGLIRKIAQYATTPAPLKIPTTPAPTTAAGVFMRLCREVVLFESLFKSDKWIWLFGWMFHVALVLVLSRHGRYFVAEPGPLLMTVQTFGIYGGGVMVAGLLALWGRRLFIQRIRYISIPSDHLMLALLVGIGASGLMMKFFVHTDIVAVKAFLLGLLYLDLQPLPQDPALLLHLALVALLMIVFPVSKLLHAPGVFFSPTRNQIDNPRERRHLAPWAASLDR